MNSNSAWPLGPFSELDDANTLPGASEATEGEVKVSKSPTKVLQKVRSQWNDKP
jgi:hypothetical protein